MRRTRSGVAGLVFLAAIVPVSSAAWGRTICVPADQPAPVDARPTETTRVPRTVAVAERETADGATRYLAFSGSASYVYNSFSGCGSRFQYSIGDAVNLSYSRASGADPLNRLAGGTPGNESFLDANLETAVGDLGRIGYAASFHTAGREDNSITNRVAGTRLWYKSPNERIQASSEIAVSANGAAEPTGTAQRHQLSMTVIDAAVADLSTTVSFSSVDEGFKARRSAAWPDRQTVDATTKLRVGRADLGLTLTTTRNNLDGHSDRATYVWRRVQAQGSYRLEGGRLLPDQIRLYANRTEQHAMAGDIDDPTDAVNVDEAAGFAVTWRNWLDGGAAQTGGTVALSADVGAQWRDGDNLASSELVARANARLSFDLERSHSIPAQLSTGLAMTSGAGDEGDLTGRWGLSAEIDLSDLLLDKPSRSDAYMLGRVGSGIAKSEDGVAIDYRGTLAVGVRF